ncbi:MAG TPA: ATP-binding protein, partial [Polyangiaceae bacterium LLY-WYZ-15_(1-7)]|nr:ATP-binding protein [Polyangiaceae bacterium LLY-WYZ-15_(1-7)]
ADLRSTIGRLSALYVDRRSAAMTGLDALLAGSRSIFEGLGWNLALWELHDDGPAVEVSLRYSVFTAADATQLAEHQKLLAPISERRIPLEAMERVSSVVSGREGLFIENMPRVGSKLLRELAADVDAEGLMSELGLTRGAVAPVFVDERVAYVLLVTGRHIAERDFAAVQLFAAMVSAAEQVSALGQEMARQERHAALGQMAAQLAHEVRNPLAVLYQATSQMRRRLKRGEGVDDLMGMVEEESRRLDRLVNDLVHFAAPLEPRLRDHLLDPLVRHTLEGLQAEAPELCARVRFDVDVGEARVRADALLLRQALAHLLHNAMGHAGEGGTVRVAAVRQGDEVGLSVANDGPPLEPDVAARVFEPFFTTKPSGTGLGLAVVRRLVSDQGGRAVLDEATEGVAFSLWLPAAE